VVLGKNDYDFLQSYKSFLSLQPKLKKEIKIVKLFKI